MKVEHCTISGHHNSSLGILGTYSEEKVKRLLESEVWMILRKTYFADLNKTDMIMNSQEL